MRRLCLLAIAVAVLLATVASPFASSSPDGLQRVADDHGFAGRGTVHAVQEAAPVAGYAMPGLHGAVLPTAAAGLAGTLLVLATGTALARGVRRR